jgi:hypothetical protein
VGEDSRARIVADAVSELVNIAHWILGDEPVPDDFDFKQPLREHAEMIVAYGPGTVGVGVDVDTIIERARELVALTDSEGPVFRTDPALLEWSKRLVAQLPLD